MAELFTTFEAVEPPKVLPIETQQAYQETKQLEQQGYNFTDDYQFDLPDYDKQELDKPSFLKNHLFDNSFDNNSSNSVINFARQFIGCKYTWGGSNPNTGFDCSGLIQYVFKNIGINLPRTAMQQGKVGQEVTLQQAQPGDVIWFGSKNSPSGQHIGLVSKIDNGQIYIIDAAGKKLGITERLLPNLQIKSVRRIIGSNLNNSFSQQVISFFKNKGLTENQSRGILGNLMQESRGDHTIVNNSSGAFGLAQWLGTRKQRLLQKYGANPTMNQQLEFIWEELNTTEKKALQKLLNTNTISDATRVFAQEFERGGKDEMNMNKRIQFAYNV